MVCTDVSNLPPNLSEDLPVRLDGCPLYAAVQRVASGGAGGPLTLTAKASGQLARTEEEDVKVVVLATQLVRWNVTEYLRTGKLERLAEQRDVSVTSFSHAVDSHKVNFNVFEVHALDTALYAPFVSDGAVFVIVLELEQSEFPQNEVMNRIDFIRAIVSARNLFAKAQFAHLHFVTSSCASAMRAS